MNKTSKRIYSVGIYARLSVDVSERKNESIDTQIEIAKEFIKRQNDMIIFDCYTDIGKSGTNFKREGFERMMHDVKNRMIDCIIVKDLSRFGRNYIETGNYIEKIFPFMGVRFIAVNDNYDSMDMTGANEIWNVNLRNLVNEMYAEDISIKAKSGRKAKWEQGCYIGGVPPYGYKVQWIGDKRHLFAEEMTSEIVKKIYELFLSGMNIKDIVVWLYERGIVRPMEYQKTGKIFCKEKEELHQWSKGTVKIILTNPVYTGCLVKGKKYGRYDIKSKELTVKENTHEAIISKDIFFEVSKRFEKSSAHYFNNKYQKKILLEEDIFADVLYCGDCGSRMKRITTIKRTGYNNGIRAYSYNCPKTGRIDREKCTSKSITLKCLTDIVKEAIRQEILMSANQTDNIAKSNNGYYENLKTELDREWICLKRKIERIVKFESEQYIKYCIGQINEEDFRHIKEENDKKVDLYKTQSAEIAQKLKAIDFDTFNNNRSLHTLIKENEKTELSAEMVRTLISRIEVYPNHRLKVIFAFKRKEVI